MPDRNKILEKLDRRFEFIRKLFEDIRRQVDAGLMDETEPGREWLEQWCVGRGVQLCPGDFHIGDSIGMDMDQRKLALDFWAGVDHSPWDGELDYVVTNYLEVFSNTSQILEEWVTALRTGGVFAVVCRDTDAYQSAWGPLKNPRRAVCFTLKTLTAYMTRAGLRVKEYERTNQELRVMAVKI